MYYGTDYGIVGVVDIQQSATSCQVTPVITVLTPNIGGAWGVSYE